MRYRIEPRRATPASLFYLTPVLAVGVTVALGALLFGLLGYAPGATLYHFFVSPITTVNGLAELALKATPLVMIAVGLAAGFRAGVWNIGAEGQLTMGAIAGGVVALRLVDVDAPWVLPLMALAGILGGMAWGAVPAVLKTRFGVSEILVSLMLTYVAVLLLGLLVHGPLKDPTGYGFPQSAMFGASANLPLLVEGTRLNAGAIVGLLVVLAAWLVMARTIVGFQIRVVGEAPAAARYAGFSGNRVVWLTLMASAGLAGLAGVFEVAGPIGQLVPSVSPGYGFTAIIVAFLGRLHPVGIGFAGLLVALSYIGGENAQVAVNLPRAATGVFQGLLLFVLLASDFILRYRVRRVPPAGAPVSGALR
ncbi:MAG TPA: ABC transporter permease [Salinarimonas sp.]|nr:ABC transporter permease [Salinarimonas sp.]